jgi:hypothetical protein
MVASPHGEAEEEGRENRVAADAIEARAAPSGGGAAAG